MNAIKNITIGHTERLYKPVGYTMLANLVNIVPFCLSIEAIRIIFNAFDGSGQPLDTTRLWWIFGVMAIYMLVMALAERASYRANFRGCQFPWSIRNECFGTLVAGGTPAKTFIRLPFKARPRRLVLHAYYGFHDGRNGNFSPSPPIDGCRGNASAGFCFIDMDRLEDGGQYVCRLAPCLARPMGKHKGAAKSER